jgi:hypothetical protein
MPHDLRAFRRKRLDIPLLGISPGIIDVHNRPIRGEPIVGEPHPVTTAEE